MKRLLALIPIFALLTAGCSKSTTIDSPIVGEYEFGYSYPDQIKYGDMIFNSDGSIDGRKPDSGEVVKKIYNYEVENDSILTLLYSEGGDKIECIFIMTSESPDTIHLRTKAIIRTIGGNAPGFMKSAINVFSVVEYDEQRDTIPSIAYLKKKVR